ncbi:hypothetical protein DERP_002738 [Dermatophagoides pteronyssinus]|uniref:Uncharacterized protein n=1 Tax=Dermatophagoides pteronyssinus TaxID=6956 RepID=A0ABQ8JVI2_DERPT|nr:hypothetical protein DERP_002738 [Dermatophagoides pteronyssinus]
MDQIVYNACCAAALDPDMVMFLLVVNIVVVVVGCCTIDDDNEYSLPCPPHIVLEFVCIDIIPCVYDDPVE